MPDSEATNPVNGKSHSKKYSGPVQFGPDTRPLVPDSWHPRKASQSHQQGLLGVQAGRQVKSRTQRQGAEQRRRGGAQATEQQWTEGVSPTSADGEHDIRDPHSQTGEEACATGRIRDGASRPKVQPMVLLPDHFRSKGPPH